MNTRNELEASLATAKANYAKALSSLDATNTRLMALSARNNAEDALARHPRAAGEATTSAADRRRLGEDRRKAVSDWAKAVDDRRKAISDRRNPEADLAKAEADLARADEDLKRATSVLEELERQLGKA